MQTSTRIELMRIARQRRCCEFAALVVLACIPDWGRAAAPVWPDTPFSRLEALALLQTLNSELLSHDSATLTLEHWCSTHHLADPAQVLAQRDTGIEKPATEQQRQLLRVGPDEVVRYRHVQLACGGVVLSLADNWYVPSRLTAEMSTQLDHSDTPFGKVVSALHFQRHTLSAQLLWQPLSPGWEAGAALNGAVPPATDAEGVLTIPAIVLEHRALLTLPDGTPFSEVVESYTGKVLAFPMPLAAPPQPPALPLERASP